MLMVDDVTPVSAIMPRQLSYFFGSVVGLLCCFTSLAATIDASRSWQVVPINGNNRATERHEASAVAVGNALYLMGGRGNKPVEVYDTVTGQWQSLGVAPVDMHHFQPVVIGQDIYIVGAQTGGYPDELSVPDIHVFNTVTRSWSVAGVVPEARRRGSAGAVVREGKIYLVGGNTRGHNGGAVPWLDRYDPQTGQWDVLPDAPHARDHFSAAIVNDTLLAAGGRTTDLPVPFDKAVGPVDRYDFATNTWTQGASIPTLRAGTLVAAAGDELLVAGGEIDTLDAALPTVEAYNPQTNQWRSLQPMIDARHSGGGAVVSGVWHVIAGSLSKGGAPSSETYRHETLTLGVNADRDQDGLDDRDETALHNTNPDDPDSDDDGLGDGAEVEIGSDPVDADSDNDGLNDGDEYHRYGSNPLLTDTDDDQLDDYAEIMTWSSDPTKADSDSDGLNDGDEVSRGLRPDQADTDQDGLDDGAEITAQTDPLNVDTDNDGLSDGTDPDPLVAETDSEPADNGQTDPVTGTDSTSSEGSTDTGSTETDTDDSVPGDQATDASSIDTSASGGGASTLSFLWMLLFTCIRRLGKPVIRRVTDT